MYIRSSGEVRRRNGLIIGVSLNGGAVARHFEALATEVYRRGHGAALISSPREMAKAPGPRFDHSGPATVSWPSDRPTHLRDFAFFHRLCDELQPCCVIGNFGSVNVMTIVAAWKRVPSRIVWYHTLTTQISTDVPSSRLRNRVLSLRRKFIFRLATQIAANSNASAADVVNHFGLAATKVMVRSFSLPDPASFGLVSLMTVDPNLIVCVGRMDRSKGQDVLISAVPEILKCFPKAQFVFLGGGKEKAEVETLAAKLRIATACRFLGGVPHREVLSWLARAAVSVVPSRVEAFGLTNIESLSVGTPVVASRTGGIPEIVRDGVDGILVPPGDAQAIAAAVCWALANPSGLDKMRMNARARFLDCYLDSRIIPAQADWIESMLTRPGIGPGGILRAPSFSVSDSR